MEPSKGREGPLPDSTSEAGLEQGGTTSPLETAPPASSASDPEGDVQRLIADVESKLRAFDAIQQGEQPEVVDLADRVERLERREHRLARRAQAIDEQENRIPQAHAELDRFSNRLDEKGSQLEVREARLKRQQESDAEARDQLKREADRLVADRAECKQLKQSLDDARAGVEEEQRTLESVRCKFDEERERLSAELRTAIDARDEAVQQASSAREESAWFKQKSSEHAAAMRDAQSRADSLEQQLAENNDRCDELEKKLAGSENDRSELLDTLEQLQASYSQKESQYEQAEKSLRIASEKLAEFAQKLSLQAPVVARGAQALALVTEQDAQIKRLEAELADARGEDSDLRERLERLSSLEGHGKSLEAEFVGQEVASHSTPSASESVEPSEEFEQGKPHTPPIIGSGEFAAGSAQPHCEHFGLLERPFELTPDPNFLYLGEAHREGLATLVYGVQSGKGFVVLTGEVGTGKTTLLHALLAQLDSATTCAFLFNPRLEPLDFYHMLFEELGIQTRCETKSEYLLALNEFLIGRLERNESTLLIIDEAQNLSPELLEEIRLLSNLETSASKLIQIALVGQPELKDLLDRPDLRQVRQRVAIRHHLRSFDEREVAEYVDQRLERAGYTGEGLFKRGAVKALFAVTGGIPRLINTVCDSALLLAYSRNQTALGAALIREAAAELDLKAEDARVSDKDDGSGDRETQRRWLGFSS